MAPFAYEAKCSNFKFENITLDIDILCNANGVYASGFCGVLNGVTIDKIVLKGKISSNFIKGCIGVIATNIVNAVTV